MTKQDILEFFNDINDVYNNPNKHGDLSKMLDMLAQQEPCGKDINVPATDAISRQVVFDALESIGSLDTEADKKYARSVFEALPPVTPQPKTGHWSRKTKVDAYDIAGVKTWGIKCQCDRCDFTTIVVEDFGYYKYCPNCGAKMIEPQESEDKE